MTSGDGCINDNRFIPFGDAHHKIERCKVVKSRDMYFAIYRAIAQDEARPGLYRGTSKLLPLLPCRRVLAGATLPQAHTASLAASLEALVDLMEYDLENLTDGQLHLTDGQ